MKKISVIIPIWNHEWALSETLLALQNQTYKDFDVILVDDGSDRPIETEKISRYFTFPFQAIRFEKNRGAPAARNEGFRKSRGDLVLFLDADITLYPYALEHFVRALNEQPKASYVYSQFWFGFKFFPCFPFDAIKLKQYNYIHTTSLIRRVDFSGFDESLKRFQDWDLWLTMMEQGKTGIFLPEPLFRVKAHGSMSKWIPSFAFRIPWERFPWTPKRIIDYRRAEAVVKKKHSL